MIVVKVKFTHHQFVSNLIYSKENVTKVFNFQIRKERKNIGNNNNSS